MKRTELGSGAKSLARRSTFNAEPKALTRNSKPKPRRAISPASKAQRAKVKTHVCAVIECASEHCDPAHLAPRAMGRGCDDPACVIALCRLHHEQFDRGDLDLLPHLSGRGFEVELAHMQLHYSDPMSVLIRLTGCRWIPHAER